MLTIAIQSAVDRRDLGIATASANLFRSLGGAVGVAAFGAVYAGNRGLRASSSYAAPAAVDRAADRAGAQEVPLPKLAVAR